MCHDCCANENFAVPLLLFVVPGKRVSLVAGMHCTGLSESTKYSLQWHDLPTSRESIVAMDRVPLPWKGTKLSSVHVQVSEEKVIQVYHGGLFQII